MADHPMEVSIEEDGRDVVVVVDGVHVAKRVHPDTQQDGTWVTLIEGWTVTSDADHTEITIKREGRRIY